MYRQMDDRMYSQVSNKMYKQIYFQPYDQIRRQIAWNVIEDQLKEDCDE